MTIDPVCDMEVDPVAFHVRDRRRARDRARFAVAMRLIVLAKGLCDRLRLAKGPAP